MRWGFEDAAATLHRIRGEFREMPGLKLTIAQAARLWQLDPASSREFLDALVIDGILRRKRRRRVSVSPRTPSSRAARH